MQACTQFLLASFVIEVAAGHTNRHLVGVIQSVITRESRVAEELPVTERQLCAVKIGL